MPTALRRPQASVLSLPAGDSAAVRVEKLTVASYKQAPIVGILVLIGVLYSLAIQQGLPWGDDYALYFAHARNLAAGQAYSATGYLYNPAEPEIGPPAYPPLFPLLIAPVFRLAGFDLPLIKAECLLFLLTALWAVYRYLRHFLPVGYIAAVLVIIGLSPYCWKYLTNTPSSDALFLCLLFLFLERSLVASGRQWKKLSDAFVTGVLLYLCCACRTVGLILFPSLVAAESLKHSGIPLRKLWVSVAVGAMGVGIQTGLLPSQNAYLHMVNFRLHTLVEFVKEYLWSIRYQFLGTPGVSGWLLLLALVGLGILGFVVSLRSGVGLPQIFTIAYLGVIGIWTVDQDFRFLLPVIPLWLLSCCAGLAWVRERSPKRLARPLAIAIVATVAILYCPHIGRTPNGAVPDLTITGTNNEGFRKVSEFIRGSTSPGARIVFSKPKLLAFSTGRQCAVYPKTNAKAIVGYMKSIHANYLVASSAFESDRKLLFPLASTNTRLLKLVFESDGAAVYQVRIQ